MSIVRGNDELAFFLRESRGNRQLAEICFYLNDRKCPFDCYFPYIYNENESPEYSWYEHRKHCLNDGSFLFILQHLLHSEHSRKDKRYNMSVAILQQLVIYETRKKRDPARALAIYKLNSHYDLSIVLISRILNTSASRAGELATDGMFIERRNNLPVWLLNVMSG